MKTIPKTPDILRFACEQCRHELAAPAMSAGQLVRCPRCASAMEVPSSATSMEEEASNWIEQDLEQMWQEQERLEELQAPPKFEPRQPTAPPPSFTTRGKLTPSTRPKARPDSPMTDDPPPQPQPRANAPRATSSGEVMRCHSRLVPVFN